MDNGIEILCFLEKWISAPTSYTYFQALNPQNLLLLLCLWARIQLYYLKSKVINALTLTYPSTQSKQYKIWNPFSLDGDYNHENDTTIFLLEFVKGMLLSCNMTEAVINETTAVQLNCHRIHMNISENDQNCKIHGLGWLAGFLSKLASS